MTTLREAVLATLAAGHEMEASLVAAPDLRDWAGQDSDLDSVRHRLAPAVG